MTSSKAPPPIKPVANQPHGKWGDTAKLFRRSVEKPPPGMTDVRLTFDDEFSPSAAQAFSSDPDALNNPSARHLFYNQHLYDLLPIVIGKAVALGLPPFDVGFPVSFAMVDTEGLRRIFGIANGLAPSLREGSIDWLCVQCYVRYAILCNALTEPTDRKVEPIPGDSAERAAFQQRCVDALMPVSTAFFLGASLRELELSMLNRTDALRGKKTKRAAKVGGEVRKGMTSPETDARRAQMERLISEGHSVANAARLTAKSFGGTFEANRALLKPSRKK